MEQNKRLSVALKGIIKNKPAQFAEDGECEEIINLRYEDNAWRGVGMKELLPHNLVTLNYYDKVVRPAMLPAAHYIAYSAEEHAVFLLVGSSTEDADEHTLIDLPEAETFRSFAWMNNSLIVYTSGSTILLQWDNGTEQFTRLNTLSNATLPSPRIVIGEFTEGDNEYDEVVSEWVPNGTNYSLFQEQLDAILLDFLPKYAEKRNAGYFHGYACVMVAYKLYDGNFILHQGPYPINFDLTNPVIVHDGGTYPNANRRMEITMNKPVMFYFFPQQVRDDMQKWFDAGIIQSLSVFITTVESPYNVFESDVNKWVNSGGYYPPSDFTAVDSLPDAINYYHIGDIPIEDLLNSPLDEPGRYILPLDNGRLSSIETNQVLPVDNFSHHLLIPATTYSYNSRLHIGDIKTIPGKITWPFYDYFYSESTSWDDVPEWDNIFFARNQQMIGKYSQLALEAPVDKGILSNSDYSLMLAVTLVVDGVKCVSVKTIDIDSLHSGSNRALLSYPDARAIKLTWLISNINDTSAPRMLNEYDLIKHPFHNFAYAKNSTYWWLPVGGISLPANYSAYLAKPAWDNMLNDYFEQPNRVQVSEVNNLFVYPAKQSYRIGNPDYTIRAMIVAQEPMTEMQFGQFPLYVFTAGGVFALEYAGGGEVLYSRITQFLTDIIAANVYPIALSGGAIVYQEENAVKVLIGRESKDISRQVLAESENPLYNQVHFITMVTDETVAKIREKIDDAVMGRNAVNFLVNSRIGYDSRTKEILFSTNYPEVFTGEKNYTLVYQLTSGAWYKRTEVYNDFIHSITGHLGLTRDRQGMLHVINLYYLDSEISLRAGDVSDMEYPWVFIQTRPMLLQSPFHKRIFDFVARFVAFNTGEAFNETVTRGLFGYLYDYHSLFTIIPDPEGLELTFDNIANVPVADAASVSDWNTFFDLPTNGTPFTSVVVDGNKVTLIGGSGITIREGLFAGVIGETENYHLISVVDSGCIYVLEDNAFYKQYIMQQVVLPNVHTIGYGSLQDLTIATVISLPLLEQAGDYAMAFCYAIENINYPLLISAGYGCFADYHVCTSVNLPNLLIAGEECFQNMYIISSIDLPQLTTLGDRGLVDLNNISTLNLPSLTSMGDTVGDNHVFLNTTGQTITLTIPAALMTCNGGNPDGDIQYLQANNTVTIVTV